jgi:hypothetical protein
MKLNDDLGRGLIGWTSDFWSALDAVARDSVTEYAVFRNVVEQREGSDLHSTRMLGKNHDLQSIFHDFDVKMKDDYEEDVQRKVRLASQTLAVKEDEVVLKAFDLANTQSAIELGFREFSSAKNSLRKRGVLSGLGVIVSTDALTDLESELVGANTGLDVAERLLGTKVLQSNALPVNEIEAVLVQASPPAYRLVRSRGPRLRVLSVTDGNVIKMRLEESIVCGQLEPNRCWTIKRGPGATT